MAPREMQQGDLIEVRCEHPTVMLAYHSAEVPDWIYDKNAFAPTAHGQHCSAWKEQA
jgi:hypothetical protein